MLSVGSLAVRSPETLIEWLLEFGGEKIILGADARGGKISIGGWQQTTEIDLFEFLQYWFKRGITQAFCTDINRDGRMAGAAVELYRKIHCKLPTLNLIASGGITSLDDIAEIEAAGCRGAIIGKAIYENRISLAEIENFITKNAG
jgi:phosphoribosylformimino-5-aminoimidazole carboxamide ribotide isomerase